MLRYYAPKLVIHDNLIWYEKVGIIAYISTIFTTLVCFWCFRLLWINKTAKSVAINVIKTEISFTFQRWTQNWTTATPGVRSVKKKKKKDSEEALSHPAPGKAATRGPHLPLPLSQFFNRSQSKPPHKLITAIQNVNQDFFRISNTTKHRAA
jgi:hypothetical protein